MRGVKRARDIDRERERDFERCHFTSTSPVIYHTRHIFIDLAHIKKKSSRLPTHHHLPLPSLSIPMYSTHCAHTLHFLRQCKNSTYSCEPNCFNMPLDSLFLHLIIKCGKNSTRKTLAPPNIYIKPKSLQFPPDSVKPPRNLSRKPTE